jgi:hypothetical protein
VEGAEMVKSEHYGRAHRVDENLLALQDIFKHVSRMRSRRLVQGRLFQITIIPIPLAGTGLWYRASSCVLAYCRKKHKLPLLF